MKVSVDAEGLKNLGRIAIENGTEKHFIPIALEWIEAAEKEIGRLRENKKEGGGEIKKAGSWYTHLENKHKEKQR